MMRLLPRSLKGQLILLTLVGLLLSQAASFVFILNDQKSKIKREWLHNIFTRIETVKDVIESTPDEIHSKILKTSSSWALKFAINSGTGVAQKGRDAVGSHSAGAQEGFRR